MSSYQDFYCKKERRFTSGKLAWLEGSEQVWGGRGQEVQGRPGNVPEAGDLKYPLGVPGRKDQSLQEGR